MSRQNPRPDAIADGARLAAAIDGTGMLRADFATRAGVGPDTLSRMIAGKAPVLLDSYSFRKRACVILGCTMADLDGTHGFDGFHHETPESKSTRSDLLDHVQMPPLDEGKSQDDWEQFAEILWQRFLLWREQLGHGWKAHWKPGHSDRKDRK